MFLPYLCECDVDGGGHRQQGYRHRDDVGFQSPVLRLDGLLIACGDLGNQFGDFEHAQSVIEEKRVVERHLKIVVGTFGVGVVVLKEKREFLEGKMLLGCKPLVGDGRLYEPLHVAFGVVPSPIDHRYGETYLGVAAAVGQGVALLKNAI